MCGRDACGGDRVQRLRRRRRAPPRRRVRLTPAHQAIKRLLPENHPDAASVDTVLKLVLEVVAKVHGEEAASLGGSSGSSAALIELESSIEFVSNRNLIEPGRAWAPTTTPSRSARTALASISHAASPLSA